MRDSSFPFLSLLVASSASSAVDAEAFAVIAAAVIVAAVIVAVAAAYFESPVAFVADVSIAILAASVAAASVVSPVVVVVGDVPLVLVVSSAALLGLDAAIVTCCQALALAVFLVGIAASVGAFAVVDVAAVG